MGKGISASFDYLREFRLGQFRRSNDGMSYATGGDPAHVLGSVYWDTVHISAVNLMCDHCDRM